MDKERKPRQDLKPEERWPFDPMQPGDHEPARPPEELERVQKQTGRGEEKPE